MLPNPEEFLSSEDLDLRNLSDEELIAAWNHWLLSAQATNEDDKDTWSHGVFVNCPPPGTAPSCDQGPPGIP